MDKDENILQYEEVAQVALSGELKTVFDRYVAGDISAEEYYDPENAESIKVEIERFAFRVGAGEFGDEVRDALVYLVHKEFQKHVGGRERSDVEIDPQCTMYIDVLQLLMLKKREIVDNWEQGFYHEKYEAIPRGLVDDEVDQGFVRAMIGGEYRSAEAFGSYVYTAMTNGVRNAYRKHFGIGPRRKSKNNGGGLEGHEDIASTLDVQLDASVVESVGKLMEAARRLSGVKGEVLLAVLEDRLAGLNTSNEEIARQIGKKPSAFRTALTGARNDFISHNPGLVELAEEVLGGTPKYLATRRAKEEPKSIKPDDIVRGAGDETPVRS